LVKVRLGNQRMDVVTPINNLDKQNLNTKCNPYAKHRCECEMVGQCPIKDMP
jgi:hypothetical protein